MGRHKYLLRDVYLNRRGYPSGPYKTGQRGINVTYYSNFVMARFLCGVPGLINDSSTHSRTGSETTEDQRSKQVRVASYTTPMEHYDGIYSMPYINFQSPANQVSKDEPEDNNGSENIILLKRIAD